MSVDSATLHTNLGLDWLIKNMHQIDTFLRRNYLLAHKDGRQWYNESVQFGKDCWRIDSDLRISRSIHWSRFQRYLERRLKVVLSQYLKRAMAAIVCRPRLLSILRDNRVVPYDFVTLITRWSKNQWRFTECSTAYKSSRLLLKIEQAKITKP